MLHSIKYDLYNFFRQPKWSILFITSIIVSIVLPKNNLTSFSVLPLMVYFVMTINLLFLFYGAEEVRTEKKNFIIEQFKQLPLYNQMSINKLVIWGFITFGYYAIFYTTLLAYIHYNSSEQLTFYLFKTTLLYTFFMWFLPFYFSIIIGYIVFTFIPNIFSYIFMIFIWFLIMPYNSMLGFIPTSVGAWLINGDPNITSIPSILPLENMHINNGIYVQRIFMLLILITTFILLRFRVKKVVKGGLFLLLTASVLIPFISPFVPQIINEQQHSYLSGKVFEITNFKNKNAYSYNLDNYSFVIDHHKNRQELSYEVKFEIFSDFNEVHLALWDDFKIQKVLFNTEEINFEHKNNIVTLSLPKSTGELTFLVETKEYLSVGPTTFELIGTTPWYPMNPLEAANPLNESRKEHYNIKFKNNDKVISNLSLDNTGNWKGYMYGPTLLKGEFITKDKSTYPYFKNTDEIILNKQRVQTEIDKINKKLLTEVTMTCQNYYTLTTYTTFSANPDECYFFEDENLVQNSAILNQLFLNVGETSLFEAVFFDVITHESWINFLKNKYDPGQINTLLTYYPKLSQEEKKHLIIEWYQQTKGVLSLQQMVEDLEANNANR
ncbi:hypothetical protein I6G82_18955 [Lysinibacillus macroides]|uniref:Uncharacterized protein n=1 Tax=Lysinibacillus macroides TaxID=33935 RepID=A0A0N0CUJ4_9BACI|nr:hypothetical protein [Lysinibacillus macroides]KOY79987.1 hypothetical protein ADM90_22505 [Lysinibacillus macroides]QPR67275.1 hypothetical protein I6G82_18955 [Lysinibacillus macroides]